MAAENFISQFDLAVLGADDPLGQSFLKVLEESDVQVGRIYPLTLGESDGIVAFRGEEWPCLATEGFDFGQAQALVVASPHPAARRRAEQVRAQYPIMPVLTGDDVLPAPALAVARLLKVLEALGRVAQAEAFVTLPVALAGKTGMDELVNQTRGLFNMESPDPEIFPLQIAFNIVPETNEGKGRYAPASLAAAVKNQGIAGETGFTVAWAPLFFGAMTALHVRLEQSVDPAELRQALKRQENMCLMESDLAAGNPTPATDSAESADIFLGQVRVEGSNVRLWLVFDPLRMEAEQVVSAVENWIEIPANSMLT